MQPGQATQTHRHTDTDTDTDTYMIPSNEDCDLFFFFHYILPPFDVIHGVSGTVGTWDPLDVG